MRKRFNRALLLDVRIAAAVLAATVLAAAGPLIAGSIEGRITNSVTGEPILGANVRFLDRHSYVYTTTTDAGGIYRLSGLDVEEYRGQFSKDGYADSAPNIPPVKVSGDTPGHLDGQLNPWGSIRGRVLDEDGKPARVHVEIDTNVDNDTVTNADGDFTFQDLRPGSYTIYATPTPETHLRDGETVGSVPIYYPSATEVRAAARVPLTWGQDVGGIEIKLRSVPVHRVAGVVMDQAGKPVAKATVKLLPSDPPDRRWFEGETVPALLPGLRMPVGLPGRPPELAIAQTKNDGSFEFPAIQKGEWRLSTQVGVNEELRVCSFQPGAEFGACPLAGVEPVSIGDHDIEDLKIRIAPPFVIPTTADWGDAQQPQVRGFPLDVAISPLDAQPGAAIDLGPSPSRPLPSRARAVFSGRYMVSSAFTPPGFYVAAVMLGGSDVLDHIVELGPGSGPFQVIYKHDVGSVRGTVTQGEGDVVYLVRRTDGAVVHYQQTKAGSQGTFEFTNLAPGDYYVAAFDPASGLPTGADLLAPVSAVATSVRVDANAAVTVTVRANRWSH